MPQPAIGEGPRGARVVLPWMCRAQAREGGQTQGVVDEA